jgi:serine/threonine protein kinase
MFDSSRPESSEQFDMDFRPPGTIDQKYGSPPDRPKVVLQDRWEIVEALGQGGMGTVYKARDLRLSDRLCVVKKLRVDLFHKEDREQALAFFDREASMLSNLKHPNIVRIYDRFREGENYYLVMEYVEGQNLEQMLAERGEPFPEAQVAEWAIKICEVLHYLHSRRPPVIYRDLKPSNIMIDAVDGIKLVDFGIARPYREDADNTHVVSVGYSPPEQYWGGADTRSDIYALGATMYFLLTGTEPLALQTSYPKRVNHKISDRMDRIVQKATSQYVELRYQFACAMREDLEAPAQPASRQLSVKLIVALCIVALIPLIAAGLSFLTNSGRNIVESTKGRTSVRGQGEMEEIGSLSSNKPGKLASLSTPVRKPLAQEAPAKIMPITTILQPGRSLGEARPKFYPLDLAASEQREEVLTDPEGLNAVDDGQQKPSDEAAQPQ